MKILIVEDDSNMREMLEIAFKNNNFTVTIAYNGVDALKKGLKGGYDIILLDLMLPKKMGFEVISELRKSGVETPILVISGSLDAENRDKAFELGANDFMVKNFSIVELLGRVKNCANKEADILKTGNLILNVPKKEVDMDGMTINLTYPEFEILFKLLSNKHAILSEEDLNMVALGTLIKKIGEGIIEHLEGFGYMISK